MHAKLPERDVKYDNDRFTIHSYDYNIQFFPFYNARLEQMEAMLRKTAENLWPDTDIHKISDLAEKHDEEEDEEMETMSQSSKGSSQKSAIPDDILQGKSVVVFGTLFKKMQQQPNILKELDDEKKMISASGDTVKENTYISENDKLFLQAGDESIELKEGIEVSKFCTGICVALKGHINPNGSGFIVEEISYPGTEINKMETRFTNDSYYVAIVSGLGFSRNIAKNSKLTKSLNILYEMLSGFSDLNPTKKIVNLVVAGNCVGSQARIEEKDADLDKTPAWNRKVQSFTVDAVKMVDKFLANVGQYMFVDIMPGSFDPCNYLWPQQPMHPCMFPSSYKLSTIRSVTNPHRASYFGVDFLGTSGQNIESMKKCTSHTDSMDIMRQMLTWAHIAPTCPDLLHSYPFRSQDPFVIDTMPDIFFVGNQPEFGMGTFLTKNNKNVQLLSVPSFEQETSLILVDLKTLKCKVVGLN